MCVQTVSTHGNGSGRKHVAHSSKEQAERVCRKDTGRSRIEQKKGEGLLPCLLRAEDLLLAAHAAAQPRRSCHAF